MIYSKLLLSTSIKKFLLFLLSIFIIISAVSCEMNQNKVFDSSEKVTTIELSPDEATVFTQEPLKILYLKAGIGTVDWGYRTHQKENMFINFMTLSEACEKDLGFSLDFIDIPDSDAEYNAYLSYLNSGLSGDLIFPTKVEKILETSEYDTWAGSFYWNDQWIEEGMYMDITRYIPQFCPQATINFEKYPQIKQMCSRNGKIYALYAGMPTISAYSLIIKNSILEENNLDSVTDFEALLEIMNNKYLRADSIPEERKIMFDYQELLLYSMFESGYYPVTMSNLNLGIVSGLKDQDYYPVTIEDTDILDYMVERFSPFFTGNYFTSKSEQYTALQAGEQDLAITMQPLKIIKSFSGSSLDENVNFFNRGYSIFLMDAPNIHLNPFYIQVIPVPYSSTQPEKALYFMQWCMTDPDAADILTYGSAIQTISHYWLSDDNIIVPKPWSTLFDFHNLIANFSEKAYLCGNKQFNIIDEYKERTYDAIYPPFYRALDSDHMNYNLQIEYEKVIQYQYRDRRTLLYDSILEWITNPDSTLTAHDVKRDLSEYRGNEEMMSKVRDYIQSINISGGIS